MKISKEVKVGIVAVLAIALLFWSYSYLKGTNLLFKSTSVYAVYPTVPGLAVSAPIIINGVQSGVVEDIYFHPDKSSKVVVKLRITEEGLRIPRNSVADLISVDFLGSKAIGLYLGNSKEELQAGDTLISHAEKSMLDDVTEQILPIKEKAENLMISMDSAVVSFKATADNLNTIFNDHNKRNLTMAISKMQTTIESFGLLANSLNTTLATSVKPVMKTYQSLGDSLLALDLKTTLEKAQYTLDGLSLVLDKINKGEGTIGELANNDSLYVNMNAVSSDLDKLLIDFRENPKRYVHFSLFGRKDKKDKQ